MSQNELVSRKLAALTARPTSPLSPATPDSALSNLLTSSIWRTPMRCTSSSWVSIAAGSHSATSPPGCRLNVQPKGTLVSMPMTTAILPSLITLRASHGLRTIR